MRYDAFISYRHSELDMFVAKKIHKGLETIKVPHAVAKKHGKKKIKRVFRDQEELPIGSDLGNNIEAALRESEFLIVICSPRTPQSEWVLKEINTFISMHGREHVLAVLIEGEPNESFPLPLLVDEHGNAVEPLAADVRGETRRVVNQKCKTEILRLAAPLLYCNYDDLRQRHRERKLRKMVGIASAIGIVGVGFGAYSAYQTAQIALNYQEKQRNQSRYLADTALSLAEEGDRRTAALIAMEALPGEDVDRPYVARAQYALSQALRAYENGGRIAISSKLEQDLPINYMDTNQEKTRLWTQDSGNSVTVWNLETEKKEFSVDPSLNEQGYLDMIKKVSFVGENLVIVEQKQIRCFDETGELVWEIPFEQEYGRQLMYGSIDSQNGIIAINAQEQVICFDAKDGHETARFQPDEEQDFTGEILISPDGQKIVVEEARSTYEYDSEQRDFVLIPEYGTGVDLGRFYVFDLKTGERQERTWKYSDIYIMEIANNTLFIYGYNQDDLIHGDMKGQMEEVGIFAFALDTLEPKWEWCTEIRFDVLYLSESTIMKVHSYTDDDGKECCKLCLGDMQKVNLFDAETGQLEAEIPIGAKLTDMQKGNNGIGYLFVADESGNITTIMEDMGMSSPNYLLSLGEKIREFRMGGGRACVIKQGSSCVEIYNYPLGKGVEEICTYDENVNHFLWNKESHIYGVSCYDYESDPKHVYLYRMEDDSLVSDLILEDVPNLYLETVNGMIKLVGVSRDGKIQIVDATTQETENYEMPGEVSDYCDFSKETGWIYGMDFRTISVFNIYTKEAKTFEAPESACLKVEVTNDGDTMVIATSQHVYFYDIASEKISTLENQDFFLINSTNEEKTMQLSEDGAYALFVCSDHLIRILNLETKQIEDQIPFSGHSYYYADFSEDGKYIYIQGDDGLFRIYDREQQEITWSDTEYHTYVQSVEEEVEDNFFVIKDEKGIWLYQLSDYDIIAQIPSGMYYSAENQTVYGGTSSSIFKVPYKSLEFLLQEATEYVGEQELTSWEKRKYNID